MTAKTDQTEGIKCVQNLELALEKKKRKKDHPYLTVKVIRKDSEEMDVEQCVEIQPTDEATVTAKW